jgi:serine protease Do
LTPEIIVDLNILNINTSQTGLLVVDVVDNSPAAQAGLTPAIVEDQGMTAVDIVLAVDGHRTLTLEDWTGYVELEVSPGQTITLNLWRSGVTSSVIVTTMERPPYQ